MREKYFRGKNAVITGAASGIGRVFAIELAKMGANLAISDINMERLEQVRNEIESIGVKVISRKCDVSKQEDVKIMSEEALSEFKEIHFLFNNVGIAMGGPFEYFSLDHWKKIIDINIWGMIYCVRAFMPRMLEQGFGHVIVTSSMAGSMGTGGMIPYCTTKFANSGFCEALYGEYKRKGINVSIICPFPLKTNLIETVGMSIPPELFGDLSPEAIEEGIKQGKKYYWDKYNEDTGPLTGFIGGFTIERSVNRFIKKISRKKLYIYDRRYGRFLQWLRGQWPGLYKIILNDVGKHHFKLIDDTYEIAVEAAKNFKV
jgi:short-subunit dehydrogenase